MPFRRLYGEPDWLMRPVTARYSDDTIGASPATNESYEEWRIHELTEPWDVIISRSVPVRKMSSLQGLVDLVDVLVGPTNIPWRLHKAVLLADSNFARTALLSSFHEREDQKLYLPEHDPKAFDLYVKYLYTGCLNIVSECFDDLLKMYVLGDQLDTPTFLDAVFELIFECTKEGTKAYNAEQIVYIMEHTAVSSPLRNLCLDHVGRGIVSGRYRFRSSDEGNFDKELLPPEYKAELMDAVLAALSMQNLEIKAVGFDRRKYPYHRELRSQSRDTSTSGTQGDVPTAESSNSHVDLATD